MSILLQGGTALIHQPDDSVLPVVTDILITGSTISRIEQDIIPGEGVQVVKCHDKIICPGFIDTHHHVWRE